MAIRFDGRVAVVTGAGAGLGRAHALGLAKLGARVVVNDMGAARDGSGGSVSPAEEVAEEIRKAGGEAMVNGADVSSYEQVKDMVAQAAAKWGSVDLMVANAGILRDKSFGKMEPDDFAKVVSVHLTGTFNCCRAVWDGMKERNYGRIVVTTSSSGMFGNFGQANYGAAKAGIVGLMNVLAEEGRKNNIRVNTISPTAATRMTEGLIPPDVLALMKPESITPAVMYLLSEDAPTRTIMGAGAGSFAVIKIVETEGLNLPQSEWTPDAVAANFEKIADMSKARDLGGAFFQTYKYVEQAAKAAGIKLPPMGRLIILDVVVIGAGPAGLMAAETLAKNGARVTVYDRMPSVGRKFLLAGRGGLNLTHSEPLDPFLARYGAAMPHLRGAVETFPPDALRAWSEHLGQPTFVGTSGRVFPKAFKASPLLRAWLRRLDQSGVQFALRHTWTGWTGNGELRFETAEGERIVKADATILALGGGSWPRLGSDGGWVDMLQSKGVARASLRPANCGFLVAWSDVFRDRYEGQPLKGLTLSSGPHSARGDMIVTRTGIEGGAVYAISAPLRDAIDSSGQATLRVALRPDLEISDLVARLSAPRNKQSLSTYLRKQLSLSPVAIGLLQEATIALELYPSAMSAVDLSRFINDVPVKLIGTAPLERAISTAGGVSFDEIDRNFMLRKLPGVFVAGEMLDWEAPTGGYLLQASFATGMAAGHGALAWLGSVAVQKSASFVPRV